MKKVLLILAISFTSFVFTSCRDEADVVDDTVEEVEVGDEEIEIED